MSNVFMVNQSTVILTQKTESTKKETEYGSNFQKALDEFMNTDDLNSFSAKGIEDPSGTFLDQELILPSMENLEELNSRLKYLLDIVYARNDIPSNPPVELDYDYSKNEVTVKGDRDDLDEISGLINENADLKEAVRTTLAIGSHVVAMADSLKFQEEYRNSSNPEAVVDKYSWLFNDNRKMPHASIIYCDSISILSDGKELNV